MGHHAEEPRAEVVLPMGLAVRNPGCQLADAVATVPARQPVQPVVHGVVLVDAGRVYETVDVLVPRLQPQFLGADGHVVAGLLVQVAEGERLAAALPILCHTRHHVLAHLEVRVQKRLGLHHQQRIIRDALQRTELVFLLILLQVLHRIDGLECLLHQQAVGIQDRVLQGHRLSYAHWDTFLHATGC